MSHTADVRRMVNEIPKLRELLLRAHVWMVGTLIPLLVRIVPLVRVIRLLTPPQGIRFYRGVGEDRVIKAVHRCLATPRNMRRRACLREGLMLFHFLRLADLPASIHFGVYPPDTDTKRMHAHCWVTLNGRAVSSPPEDSHTVMLVRGENGEAQV